MSGRVQKQVTFLMLGMGFVGFLHGLKLAHPQVVIEGAQVLAGLVEYGSNHPQGIYHSRLWTLLNQVPALFLFIGVPERVLSLTISGVGGALFYVGLALVCFSVSKSLLLSALAPFASLWTGAAGAVSGINYPVILLNSPHTYGSFGLSLSILVLGLIGCGRLKTAMLCAGLMFGVHPAWGLWTNMVLALPILHHLKIGGAKILDVTRWWFIGVAITMLSLSWWYFHMPAIEMMQTTDTARYVTSFVEKWDYHRKPLLLFENNAASAALLWNITVLAGTAVLAIYHLQRPTSSTSELFFKSVLYASVGALLLIAVQALWQDGIPERLIMLMPNRWANFGILGFLALLLGTLFGRREGYFTIQFLLVVVTILMFKNIASFGVFRWILISLTVLLAIISHSGLARGNASASRLIPKLGAVFLISIIGINIIQQSAPVTLDALLIGACATGLVWLVVTRLRFWNAAGVRSTAQRKTSEDHGILGPIRSFGHRCGGPEYLDRLLTGLLLITLAIYFVLNVERDPPWDTPKFADYSNNVFWRAVEQQDGVLLTDPGLFMIQARTRRPVLLDGGALDWLPYLPEAAPLVKTILSDVYGVDYFDPPTRHRGRLDRTWSAEQWQKSSAEDWRTLSRKYGFSTVLVTDKWSINLPRVKSSKEGLVLYEIPE